MAEVLYPIQYRGQYARPAGYSFPLTMLIVDTSNYNLHAPSGGWTIETSIDHPAFTCAATQTIPHNSNQVQFIVETDPDYLDESQTTPINGVLTASYGGTTQTIALVIKGMEALTTSQAQLVFPAQFGVPVPSPQYHNFSDIGGQSFGPYSYGPANITINTKDDYQRVMAKFPTNENRAISWGFHLPPNFNNLAAGGYFVWSADEPGNIVWTRRGTLYLNGGGEDEAPVNAVPGRTYRMPVPGVFVPGANSIGAWVNGRQAYIPVGREGTNPADTNPGNAWIHYYVYEYQPVAGDARGLVWVPANAMFCSEGNSVVENYGMDGRWARVFSSTGRTTLEFTFVVPADFGGNAKLRLHNQYHNVGQNDHGSVVKYAQMEIGIARRVPCDTTDTAFETVASPALQNNVANSSIGTQSDIPLDNVIQPLDTVTIRITRVADDSGDTSIMGMVTTGAYVTYDKVSLTQDVLLSPAMAQGSTTAVIQINRDGSRQWRAPFANSQDNYLDYPVAQVPFTYASGGKVRIRWYGETARPGKVAIQVEVGSARPTEVYGVAEENTTSVIEKYLGQAVLHETVIPLTLPLHYQEDLSIRVWRRGLHTLDTLAAPINIADVTFEYTAQ